MKENTQKNNDRPKRKVSKNLKKGTYRKNPDPNDPNEIQGYPNEEKPPEDQPEEEIGR